MRLLSSRRRRLLQCRSMNLSVAILRGLNSTSTWIQTPRTRRFRSWTARLLLQKPSSVVWMKAFDGGASMNASLLSPTLQRTTAMTAVRDLLSHRLLPSSQEQESNLNAESSIGATPGRLEHDGATGPPAHECHQRTTSSTAEICLSTDQLALSITNQSTITAYLVVQPALRTIL